jgi:hypothetical protein
MTAIMLVLFGMFQVTGVLKERWNEYGTNEYAQSGEKLSETGAFSTSGSTPEESEQYVILVGDDENSTTGQMVELWASYQKMDFFCYDTLTAVTQEEAEKATLLFLDSTHLDFSSDTGTLETYANEGVSMVFCNLPDTQVLTQNRSLKNLLGLYKVYQDDVELTGVEVYDGFLLGGTSIYTAETEEEEKQQDLTLHMPWYQVSAGTKIYITGLMDKEPYGGDDGLPNENLPAIVWRNSIGSARIFVVSGEYASDVTALGIYSGMLYEMQDYDLYPVVNAQNFVVANFAALSSEQDETTQALYTRSQKVTFQDLIWPDLSAVITKSFNVPSFFLSPRLDYTSEESPDANRLVLYQKLFGEAGGENGLTLTQTSEIAAEDKLQADRAFYDEYLPSYTFTSLYAKTDADYESVKDEDTLDGIRTVCLEADPVEAPVAYAGDDVTEQRATVDGFYHTYSDDLRMKSLETCLGYSNILVDLESILVPQSDEDRWETRIERLASYTVTYWKPFSAFTKTTVSESDARIRQFLNLDYETSREDDVITLDINGMEESASFILRTHNEEIADVSGGSWTEIEDHAYLIEADQTTVKIRVEKEDSLYYE